MTSFDKRPRGRNNRRNGRRNYGSRSSQVIKLNDQGRAFNQQRVKFSGNATKLYEKYKKLASEALSIGEKSPPNVFGTYVARTGRGIVGLCCHNEVV